jgi:hypothetical protein
VFGCGVHSCDIGNRESVLETQIPAAQMTRHQQAARTCPCADREELSCHPTTHRVGSVTEGRRISIY